MGFAEQAARLLVDPYAFRKFAETANVADWLTPSEREAEEEQERRERRRLLAMIGAAGGLTGAGLGAYGASHLWDQGESEPDAKLSDQEKVQLLVDQGVDPEAAREFVGVDDPSKRGLWQRLARAAVTGDAQAEDWVPGAGTIGGAITSAAGTRSAQNLVPRSRFLSRVGTLGLVPEEPRVDLNTIREHLARIETQAGERNKGNKGNKGADEPRRGFLDRVFGLRDDNQLRAVEHLLGTGGEVAPDKARLAGRLGDALEVYGKGHVSELGEAFEKLRSDRQAVAQEQRASKGRWGKFRDTVRNRLGDPWTSRGKAGDLGGLLSFVAAAKSDPASAGLDLLPEPRQTQFRNMAGKMLNELVGENDAETARSLDQRYKQVLRAGPSSGRLRRMVGRALPGVLLGTATGVSLMGGEQVDVDPEVTAEASRRAGGRYLGDLSAAQRKELGLGEE